MGKRGPAPKPTALKLIEGVKANRINHNEPTAIDRPPLCPSDAAADVQAVWDYTVAELQAMGLARSADRDALRCYCEAVIAHRKAAEIVARSSILIKGLHGGLVRNPALAVLRDNAMTVKAFAQEFGLTPSARSGIAVSKPVGDTTFNPFDASTG